ncbi:variant erythrocyte surface antigen-1 family protein, partial [Babesia divergens]
MKISLRSDNN